MSNASPRLSGGMIIELVGCGLQNVCFTPDSDQIDGVIGPPRSRGLAAAQATGQQLLIFDASNEPKIASAFKSTPSAAPVRCWLVLARSLTSSENTSSRWLLVTRCQRCLIC